MQPEWVWPWWHRVARQIIVILARLPQIQTHCGVTWVVLKWDHNIQAHKVARPHAWLEGKEYFFIFDRNFFYEIFFLNRHFFKTATETVSGSTSIVYSCTPAGFACLAGASFSQDNATVTITQCCSTNYCNSAANSSISFGLFIATLALFVLSH